MNVDNLTLSPQAQAIGNTPKAASSNAGTIGGALSAMLTGSPMLGAMGAIPGIIQGAFQEDPGKMDFLPSFDGGKIDAGAATKTTVFGAIQTGSSGASGWSKATSSPSQTAPQDVSPNAPSPLSSNNFPLFVLAGVVAFISLITLLK